MQNCEWIQLLEILSILEPNFFKVAYSNTRFHNGNANFKFHNPILLKYYQNFVLPLIFIVHFNHLFTLSQDEKVRMSPVRDNSEKFVSLAFKLEVSVLGPLGSVSQRSLVKLNSKLDLKIMESHLQP